VASLVIQISMPLSSFVVVLLIARYIDNLALGQLSTSLSTYYIFEALATLGMSTLIIRDVAQDKNLTNAYLSNGSILATVFAALAALLMVQTAYYITDDPKVIKCVWILSLSLMFSSPTMVMQSICAALEKFEHIMIPILAANIAKTVFGFIILLWTQDIVKLSYVLFLCQVINCFGSMYYTSRYVNKALLRIDLRFIIRIMMNIPVFGFVIIVSSIRNNIDVLLLTKLLGPEETGYYSAAIKLVNLLKTGISCYIVALAPVIYREYTESKDRLEMICFKSIQYLMIGVIPIAFGTVIISESIISMIFGPNFLPSADALSVSVWITLFYSLNQIFANVLIGSSNQDKNLYANLLGLASGILLYFLLIPKYSYVGCAFATTASVMITALLQYFFVLKAKIRIHFLKTMLKPLVAVSVMVFFAFVLRAQNIFLIIAVSATIYLALLIGLKAFQENDVRVLKSLFRRSNTVGSV
jgi:O-antigen/teichoic acid export membrane protein